METPDGVSQGAGWAVVAAFFDRLARRDMEAFFDLWAEDGVFEMPFTAPGLEPRYPGLAAVRRFFTVFRNSLGVVRFVVTSATPLGGDAGFVVEGRGECETAAGKPYRNQYVWVVHLRGGKLTLFREYSNPLVIIDGFGGADVLRGAFGGGP